MSNPTRKPSTAWPTSPGRSGRGLRARVNPEGYQDTAPPFPEQSAADAVHAMTQLASALDDLGTAAARELAGEDLGDLRYAITGCLGFHECTYLRTPYNEPIGEPPKVPIVAAVSGAAGSVLEAATGYVDRIYVIVPLEGGQEVAQGGVFSYYEFIQPRDQRLTDDEWRQKLDTGQAPQRPAWADAFSLEGGAVAEALFFRVGDTYLVTRGR